MGDGPGNVGAKSSEEVERERRRRLMSGQLNSKRTEIHYAKATEGLSKATESSAKNETNTSSSSGASVSGERRDDTQPKPSGERRDDTQPEPSPPLALEQEITLVSPKRSDSYESELGFGWTSTKSRSSGSDDQSSASLGRPIALSPSFHNYKPRYTGNPRPPSVARPLPGTFSTSSTQSDLQHESYPSHRDQYPFHRYGRSLSLKSNHAVSRTSEFTTSTERTLPGSAPSQQQHWRSIRSPVWRPPEVDFPTTYCEWFEGEVPPEKRPKIYKNQVAGTVLCVPSNHSCELRPQWGTSTYKIEKNTRVPRMVFLLDWSGSLAFPATNVSKNESAEAALNRIYSEEVFGAPSAFDGFQAEHHCATMVESGSTIIDFYVIVMTSEEYAAHTHSIAITRNPPTSSTAEAKPANLARCNESLAWLDFKIHYERRQTGGYGVKWQSKLHGGLPRLLTFYGGMIHPQVEAEKCVLLLLIMQGKPLADKPDESNGLFTGHEASLLLEYCRDWLETIQAGETKQANCTLFPLDAFEPENMFKRNPGYTDLLKRRNLSVFETLTGSSSTAASTTSSSCTASELESPNLK